MKKEKLKFPHILIVKSSAGSGKTYNLALRYLQLLLMDRNENPFIKSNINNILAITFSNKAASEMRQRIIDWMKKITLDMKIGEKTAHSLITEPLIIDSKSIEAVSKTEKRIRYEISAIFNNLLQNYDDFKVSTIDSFVSVILKASSFRLGIAPDFEITKDVENYFEYAINEIFQDMTENSGIRNIFDEFIKNYTSTSQEKTSWDPKDIIISFIRKMWDKECHSGKKIGTASVSSSFNSEQKILNDIKKIEGYLLNSKDLKVNKTFLRALEKNEIFALGNWVSKKLLPSGLLNKDSKMPQAEYCDLWESLKNSMRVYVENLSQDKILQMANVYKLFLDRLENDITLKRKIMLINQLNNMLKRITGADDDFIPEIYYYISERYFHFLLDEFQDTNYIQWQNLEKLVFEATSKGGSLFIVGDKKQSIYRWRGGNPELSNEIEQNFQNSNIYKLETKFNYRSDEVIIDFNNKIFNSENIKKWLKNLGYENTGTEIIYEDSFQNCPKDREHSGYVQIEKIESGHDKTDFYKIVKEKFKSIIKNTRERFNDRDIAVLARKNDEVKDIVEWLLEEDINVQANLTVNIKYHPRIKEIISLLQFLNNPSDNYSFIQFITGEIFRKISRIETGEIYKWINENILSQKSEFLYRNFQKFKKDIWEEYFGELFKKSGYLPLYEFIVLLFKKWGILQNFPQFSPYFLHLLELIKNRSFVDESNICDFLEYYNRTPEDDEALLLKSTENLDAIKVLSIHKAKGLEFPVVILPFAGIRFEMDNMIFREDEDSIKTYYVTSDYIPFSEELEEIYNAEKLKNHMDELNSFYVSATRPKNELYILAGSYSTKKNYLEELIFTEPYENVISLGKQSKTRKDAPQKIAVLETGFDDLKKDVNWLELLKTKVKKPEEISRKSYAAKERGNVIHYILSQIERLPDKEIERKITNASKKFGSSENLTPIINGITTNFKKYFIVDPDDEVFIEKEIVNAKGELNIVDRFIIRKDKIELVDFKTGEEYKEDHSLQIKRYKDLLKQIYPGKKIECYLIYMDENRQQEV